jgi:hypothetical protein
MNTKKVLIVLVLIFVLGVVSGYFLGGRNKAGNEKGITIENSSDENKKMNTDKKDKLNLKIDLLKDYTELLGLPEGTIPDPVKYADAMGSKVQAIDDDELAAKYFATGESNEKTQKIKDFLDYLNESIKADLQ